MKDEIIVVFDTETTGLLPRKGSDLSLYPHMAEIYAAQINQKTGDLIKEIDTLIKIPVPMPPKLTKTCHGITDEMMSDKPTFVEVYPQIAEVFRGASVVVAANVMLDIGVLVGELRRIDMQYAFPYPPERFCIIAEYQRRTGQRLSNSKLYKLATGEELLGAHRAKADVMATYATYSWLKEV